jgi:hypothetical protein
MYRTKIHLNQAVNLEEQGEIKIVSTIKDGTFHPKAQEWYSNYLALREKARHIKSDKVFDHFPALYSIELSLPIDGEAHEWIYLYGIENTEIKTRTKDNIEYIYILINPGYPEIVKIGMTVRTIEDRVNSINATSTVNEWVPKFGLAVSKGSAFNIEQQMHKYFAHHRIDSDHGNSREFFKLSPLTAFDKLREIGSLHQVGEPIVY